VTLYSPEAAIVGGVAAEVRRARRLHLCRGDHFLPLGLGHCLGMQGTYAPPEIPFKADFPVRGKPQPVWILADPQPIVANDTTGTNTSQMRPALNKPPGLRFAPQLTMHEEAHIKLVNFRTMLKMSRETFICG